MKIVKVILFALSFAHFSNANQKTFTSKSQPYEQPQFNGECLLSDDFSAPSGLWYFGENHPDVMKISASSGRLDFWSPMENDGLMDAFAYAISDGWKIDMTQDWGVFGSWNISNLPTPTYGEVGIAFAIVLEGDIEYLSLERAYTLAGGRIESPKGSGDYETTSLWYGGKRTTQTDYPLSGSNGTTYVWYDAAIKTVYYNDEYNVPYADVSLVGLSDETSAWIGVGGFSRGEVPSVSQGSLWIDDVCLMYGNVIDGSGTVIEINFPDGIPSFIDPNGSTLVSIEVSGGDPIQGSGALHINEGEEWYQIPLTEKGQSTYIANFPFFNCGQTVDWYISFDSQSGDVVTSPEGAPFEFWSSDVYTAREDIFSDNFETNQGWAVYVEATEGSWVRGVPSGSGVRCDPPTDADGSGSCYVTGNTEDEDIDNGQTMLYSPVIEVNMNQQPVLSYYRWYSNGADCDGINPYEDSMEIQISIDGGMTFSELETVGPDGIEAEGEWFFVEFNLVDVLDSTGTVDLQLLVTAGDEGMSSIVEAGFDGVGISIAYCDDPLPCIAADINNDGTVGVGDLLSIVDHWGETDVPADVNADGIVGVGDLLAVVDSWGPCE